MKKIHLLVILFIAAPNLGIAQYWAVFTKIGASSSLTHAYSAQNTNRRVELPGHKTLQEMQSIKPKNVELPPEKSIASNALIPTVVGGVYLHTPIFIGTGLEYYPLAFSSLYQSRTVDTRGYFYVLEEYNIAHTLAIPLYFNLASSKMVACKCRMLS